MENDDAKVTIVLSCFLVAVIGFLILAFTAWDTVPAGNKGVRLRFGGVTGDVVDSGFYWKVPFIDRIKDVNTQTQKVEMDADAASSDLQTVIAKVALNYNLEGGKVGELYQNTGLDYADKIITPSLAESVKSVTARYTADQLISKRSEVNGGIYDLMKEKLSPYGIQVQGLNIVNFNFSKSFNEAIENKVTAEQNALASQNKLKQVQFEAEQRVAEAEGKAKALRVESDALNNNPSVLQLRMIEKWNGVLPMYSGAVNPFVSLNK